MPSGAPGQTDQSRPLGWRRLEAASRRRDASERSSSRRKLRRSAALGIASTSSTARNDRHTQCSFGAEYVLSAPVQVKATSRRTSGSGAAKIHRMAGRAPAHRTALGSLPRAPPKRFSSTPACRQQRAAKDEIRQRASPDFPRRGGTPPAARCPKAAPTKSPWRPGAGVPAGSDHQVVGDDRTQNATSHKYPSTLARGREYQTHSTRWH